jgi:hypothetical protein
MDVPGSTLNPAEPIATPFPARFADSANREFCSAPHADPAVCNASLAPVVQITRRSRRASSCLSKLASAPAFLLSCVIGDFEETGVRVGNGLRVSITAVLAMFSAIGCAERPGTVAPHARNNGSWTFAVSGDSRNCGNVVMPAIAADAKRHDIAFYWHLGDLRAIYKADEDFVAEQHLKKMQPSLNDYLFSAWSDFRQHQIAPFGTTPFFIGIGNHETIAPKTRTQFQIEFQSELDRPELQAQREHDLKATPPIGDAIARTYYHWVEHGVDFVNLDNASNDAFDARQLIWFDRVIDADVQDASIQTVVVGMHESLPYSVSSSHSMCDSGSGRESGVLVYEKLLDAQRKGKRVYLLASHSHYFLSNIYDTPHWRERGNVLPGWVIGTAGAERYLLPDGIEQGAQAREHTYGYLLADVNKKGEIAFTFHELDEAALQATRIADYTPETVTWCVEKNARTTRGAQPATCERAGEP